MGGVGGAGVVVVGGADGSVVVVGGGGGVVVVFILRFLVIVLFFWLVFRCKELLSGIPITLTHIHKLVNTNTHTYIHTYQRLHRFNVLLKLLQTQLINNNSNNSPQQR
jgi:hypothetical protein